MSIVNVAISKNPLGTPSTSRRRPTGSVYTQYRYVAYCILVCGDSPLGLRWLWFYVRRLLYTLERLARTMYARIMAAVSHPTKFVQSPSSHLLCSVCGKLFQQPVINIQCGHTFCRECVLQAPTDGRAKCPVDDISCEVDSLVLNRALLGQIDDLDVYCSYGLVWSEKEHDYVTDPLGCPEKIKFGQKKGHEEACGFAVVSCPNGSAKCGQIRRKDLEKHMKMCTYCSCLNINKGCRFQGSKQAVDIHAMSCGFRALSGNGITSKQVEELKTSNKELETKVDLLTKKVDSLESVRDTLVSQLENCTSMIHRMQQSMDGMQDKLDRHLAVRRSSSSSEARKRLSSSLHHCPSTTSGRTSPSHRVESWDMPFQFKCIGTLRGHKSAVWDLKARGNLLYSCGEDKVIKVWDLESLAKGCRQTLHGHNDRIQAMAIGDKHLYSGGADKAIYVWSLDDYSEVQCIEDAHTDVIAAMVCSGSHLYTSSLKVIKVWDAKTLEHIHTISGLYHWVRSLTFNPAKDRLYSGGHNTIEIWDATGKFNLKGKISHTYGSSYSLAVTNQYIIAGTYNQNIHIFDVQSQQYLKKLSGHVGTVMTIVASNSGRFLFTASTDASVQIWNLENMLPIQKLSRHDDSVNSVIIRGDLLLTGSEDSEIKVFKYFKMQMGFVPEL